MLSSESRRVAGILLVVFPTVLYGGVSLLMFLLDRNSGYMQNPLRQNLFRAGHAHAGVLLVLSLLALRYVDEAELSARPLRDSIRRDLSADGVLLFRPVARDDGAQRLHLPRLCRSDRIGCRA